MKPNLRAVPDEHVTRKQIELERIKQSHREWRSPWSDVSKKAWNPIETEATKPIDVDSVLSKQYRIVVESEVGWFRKLIRWMRGHS